MSAEHDHATLWPRWADSVLRIVLGVLALGVVTLIAFPILGVRTAYVTGRGDPVAQPIAFDHRHHVRDAAIDCRFCHAGAEKAAMAGVPATQLCMGCHGQIWPQAGLLEPVRASYFEDKPIRWTRVHRLPEHVFFDHSIHVTRGIDCSQCHGPIDTMGQVAAVAPLTMGWCLDCHRNPGRSDLHPPTYCSGCHR